MVDRGVFERRLAKLEELLSKLRPLAELDPEEYLADEVSQSLAERWLHLAVECALDLAHHLIASCGWPPPSTYRETFQLLAKEGALPAELAAQMEEWAGLRNVLVHLYLEIDQGLVFAALSQELDQLESYAAAIARAAFGSEE